MAIWYNSPNMDWMIAPLQYLGGSKHYIDGFGDQGKLSCPYTVPNNTWKYKTREWVVPDNIDINVKCLAGKESLFRDHLFKTLGIFKICHLPPPPPLSSAVVYDYLAANLANF